MGIECRDVTPLPGLLHGMSVLQKCFFAISEVLSRETALERVKETVPKTYAEQGADALRRELVAVDQAVDGLHRDILDRVTATRDPTPVVPDTAESRSRLPNAADSPFRRSHV